MDDYEYSDTPCPKCGHSPTHTRWCYSCDDGYIDEHDYDPINYSPGELLMRCYECNGTANVRWCPKCGCDLNYYREAASDEAGNT